MGELWTGVTRRQLSLVEGSLREVLTKRRYVLKVRKMGIEDDQGSQ